MIGKVTGKVNQGAPECVIPVVGSVGTIEAAELHVHAGLLHRLVAGYVLVEEEIVIAAVENEVD